MSSTKNISFFSTFAITMSQAMHSHGAGLSGETFESSICSKTSEADTLFRISGCYTENTFS